MWQSSHHHQVLFSEKPTSGVGGEVEAAMCVEFWTTGVPVCSLDSVCMQQIACPCQDRESLSGWAHWQDGQASLQDSPVWIHRSGKPLVMVTASRLLHHLPFWPIWPTRGLSEGAAVSPLKLFLDKEASREAVSVFGIDRGCHVGLVLRLNFPLSLCVWRLEAHASCRNCNERNKHHSEVCSVWGQEAMVAQRAGSSWAPAPSSLRSKQNTCVCGGCREKPLQTGGAFPTTYLPEIIFLFNTLSHTFETSSHHWWWCSYYDDCFTHITSLNH